MKNYRMTALLLTLSLILTIGCTKNTQEITESPKHVIKSGILSRQEVSAVLPKNTNAILWNKKSIELKLDNGVTVYKTVSIADAGTSLNVYRRDGKQAVSISTFKPENSTMHKLSLFTLAGENQLDFSVKDKDGALGNFKFYNESQRTLGECMQHLIDQCIDSWGCRFLLVIMAEEIGIAMTAQCIWQVGHER